MDRLQKSKLLIFVFFICFNYIFLITGCFENPIDSDNNLKETEQLNEAGFPLAVGNYWVYHVQAMMTTLSPDTTETSWDVDVLWEITSMEHVLGVDAFRMETTHHVVSGPDSGRTATMITWFTVKEDTLLAVASGPQVGLNPESAQLLKISVVSNQDEPEEWPVTTLVFPLEVGKEWAYFRPDPEFLGNKKVESVDIISVPAGNYEAFRIVRAFTLNENERNIVYSLRQWFTSIGVVKYEEYYDYEGLEREIDENGNIINENNVRSISVYTMELLDYHINE